MMPAQLTEPSKGWSYRLELVAVKRAAVKSSGTAGLVPDLPTAACTPPTAPNSRAGGKRWLPTSACPSPGSCSGPQTAAPPTTVKSVPSTSNWKVCDKSVRYVTKELPLSGPELTRRPGVGRTPTDSGMAGVKNEVVDQDTIRERGRCRQRGGKRQGCAFIGGILGKVGRWKSSAGSQHQGDRHANASAAGVCGHH